MNYDKNYFTKVFIEERNAYDIYLKYIDQLKIPLKNKTILDVGCATGEFVKSIMDNNNCYGFDISAYAIDKCKKKFLQIKDHFFCFDLNEKTFDKKLQFDVITMFDIIEHLDNFAYVKELFKNNLKKGGYLVIATANSNGILRFISPSKFTGEIDPTHTMLFTPYTLDFFLKRSGLKKVYVSTPYGFYFKKNLIAEHLLFGGQIFAVYKKD